MIYTTKISRYDIEILTKRNMKSSLPKVEDLDENNFNNFNIFRFRIRNDTISLLLRFLWKEQRIIDRK